MSRIWASPPGTKRRALRHVQTRRQIRAAFCAWWRRPDPRHLLASRAGTARGETAVRLVAVIGPAEELFWRGLVQEALMRRYGRWTGAAMAAVAYSAVHVTTGNFTLMGAAGIAGAHWCVLYAAGVPIGALIVSHCAWDVWIFLVQPTGEVAVVGSAAPAAAGA